MTAFVPEKTKNFTAITSPLAGVYCLTPDPSIDPTKVPAFATPEWGYSDPSFNIYLTYVNAYFPNDCQATDFEVVTYTLPLGGMVSDAVSSDTVAFTIVVP
jgi:hypothetical protein